MSLDALPDSLRALLRASGAFSPDAPFSLSAAYNAADQLREAVDYTPLLTDWWHAEDAHHVRHRSADSAAQARAALEANPHAAAEVYRRAAAFYQTRSQRWSLYAEDDPTFADERAQVAHLLTWAATHDATTLVNLTHATVSQLERRETLHPQARVWLAYAAQVLQAAPDEWGVPGPLRALGDAALLVRAFMLAESFYIAALTRCGEDALGAQAHILRGLGQVARAQENLDAARNYFYKALVLYDVVGFSLGQASMQRELAALPGTDAPQALDYLQQAVRIYETLEHTAARANTLRELAAQQQTAQRYEAAQGHLEEAYIAFGEVEFWAEQAHTLRAWGDLHLAAGAQGQARAKYDQALTKFRELQDRSGQAQTLRARGDVHLSLNDIPAAIEDFEAARLYYAALGQAHQVITLRVLLAHLYLDDGQRTPAAAQLAALLPDLPRITSPLRQHELRARLRDLVGRFGGTFETLWMQASGASPLPDWLIQPDPDAPPESLAAALTSAEALLAALPGVLAELTALKAPARAEWLDRALALLGDDSPQAHLGRAEVLAQRASIPGADVAAWLDAALEAYDQARAHLTDDPPSLADVHNRRAKLLRDMAGMPQYHRRELLLRALTDADTARETLADGPTLDYAHTQLHRAHLLRELAGLRGENRAQWMYAALAAFDEVVQLLADDPPTLARAQLNRASLWQEITTLPEVNVQNCWREALHAVALAMDYTQHDPDAQRRAGHMLDNLRTLITAQQGEDVFQRWWADLTP